MKAYIPMYKPLEVSECEQCGKVITEPMNQLEFRSNKMKRDTELLKIQVYASYCHSTFRGRVSFVFGMIVAYYILLIGLYLQKAIDSTTYLVSIFAFFPFLVWFLGSTYSRYQRRLNRVNELIEMVNKDKSLPSIEDMIKGKGLET